MCNKSATGFVHVLEMMVHFNGTRSFCSFNIDEVHLIQFKARPNFHMDVDDNGENIIRLLTHMMIFYIHQKIQCIKIPNEKEKPLS